MFANYPAELPELLLWGLLATFVMTTILQGAQGLGLSRLSLPFLVGTFFSGDRRVALIVGFVLYTIGGWIFTFFYFLIFASLKTYTWWLGAAVGMLHGWVLLVGALPLLPYVHPRIASEYDGPTAIHTLEPPGFLALNYGYGTPLTTLFAQTIYGAVLGGFLELRGA
jgi:hypothetical protein